MAMDRLSPNHAARRRVPPVQDLPELRQFSDVAWIYWKNLAPPEVLRNVRGFFSLSITNAQTQSIISRIMSDHEQELESWPGTSFRWGTEQFRAILGSPNGQGFGYFLLQHKVCGNFSVEQVQTQAP